MTRTRVDCQSSSEDRYEAVCWRRAGKANASDMAAQLDHADSDGLLRDRPCTAMGCCVLSGKHTFSEEQKEMHVECSSGVNGRPRHGGTRWLESDLERQASSWTTSRCVEVTQRAVLPAEEECRGFVVDTPRDSSSEAQVGDRLTSVQQHREQNSQGQGPKNP